MGTGRTGCGILYGEVQGVGAEEAIWIFNASFSRKSGKTSLKIVLGFVVRELQDLGEVNCVVEDGCRGQIGEDIASIVGHGWPLKLAALNAG